MKSPPECVIIIVSVGKGFKKTGKKPLDFFPKSCRMLKQSETSTKGTEMTMTNQEMLARIAELEAKVETANKPKPITFKVGQKGGLSVYGLGRFPVTLYRGQWERLLEQAEQIKAFMEAHKSELKEKA